MLGTTHTTASGSDASSSSTNNDQGNRTQAKGEQVAAQIMQFIAEWAPVLLVCTAGLAIAAVGVIRYTYAVHLFSQSPLLMHSTIAFFAFSVACVSACARFGALAMSYRDVLSGRSFGAIVGGTLSIGLCIYEIREAGHYVSMWQTSNPVALLMIVRFMIVVSFLLEVRMVIGYIRGK